MTTPATTPPAAPELVLGPDGYGALTLGMVRAEAIATGLTDGTLPGDGNCGGPGDGVLAGTPAVTDDRSVAGRLFFSAESGQLVAIYAYPGVKTPEGIGIGSSYATVVAAYPTWRPIGADPHDGRGGVRVPGNTNASYRIVVIDETVVEISLDSHQQDCYE